MKFGTNAYMFTEYGAGKMPQMVKFFQTADDLGFSHIRYLDHVIGINAEKHGGIAQTPYTSKSYIHEAFTLFAYMAALTKRVEFGRYRLEGRLDIFNSLNANPVVAYVQTHGANYQRVSDILSGRVVAAGATFTF